ncbi:hypothetical protein AURDEDRAFT_174494 [Auricularia subglabra TFB-10046 SS5]|uniref:F-box domain-containing protein n=1 Tax=Auricularia subglabra (strain TFB-10046 / SS5) TaxID=717982 RepID=J0CYQ4_AURST|nr:hypothetical protein AURDEDRAFT_174494 [Auricularia subglabra TFB-10046 SS5]
MLQLPTKIAESIIDYIDDDRSSLLSCSMIASSWRVRSLAHLFRILQVTQSPDSFDRWWSSSTAPPVAFVRVTIEEFARLMSEFAPLVRFVVHLQIGDWMDVGAHDDPFTAFLAHLHLPAGNSVERLSLFGHFSVRPEHLRRNFGNVTVIRTHSRQYTSLRSFAACLEALSTLTFVEVTGNEFRRSRARPARSLSPSGVVLRPNFSAGCCVTLKMDTNSRILPGILRWVSLDPSSFASVALVGFIPSYENGQLTDKPLGHLLDDPTSPILRTIRSLDVGFEEVMLSAFTRLVNHLPMVNSVCCTVAFQNLWPTTLSRAFARELWTPTLRRLEIVTEHDFTNPLLMHKTWEALSLALRDPKWRDLDVFVLRLKWRQTVPLFVQEPIQRKLDNLFRDSKVSVFLEGKRATLG